ncbi:MAG: hypothetical protein JST19_10475 [Bacteroidetes bacterium]|nr:hypothetical protein [Bacteroidota bacterium]
MKRELPVYNIQGTDFVIEAQNLLLREKANPANTISFFDMRDLGNGYELSYNPQSKNLPIFLEDGKNIITVTVPELVKLDPVGMAEKYGCTVAEIAGKTDFDLMVDQQALASRLSGKLTIVDIAGHTFYVDIPMDMLRPKDDFLSKGIVFNDIDAYYDEGKRSYIIPYNPKTHEFQEPDYNTITAAPQDLIVVSFPFQRELDPIGFNRKAGLPPMAGLKETNVRSHFVAEKVDWKDTGIGNIIRGNIQKQQRQKQAIQAARKTGRRIRRGRGI